MGALENHQYTIDYDEFRGRGRPTNIDVWLRKAGEELRNNIRDALHAKGLTRKGTQKKYARDHHNRINII